MKLILVATSTVVAAGVIAATACGQSSATAGSATPPPLRLVERDAHFAFVDIAPKGGMRKPPSQGDQFVIGGRLTAGGKPSGTSNLVCTITQPGSKGLSECVGTLVLPTGTIAIGGVSRLATNADTYAICGGTGAYAKATGTVASAQSKGGADVLTVQLG